MSFDVNFFKDVAAVTLRQLPSESRFSADDAKVISENAEVLLGFVDGLTQQFYDSLFGHPLTKAVFRDGERPTREQTFRHWWERTVRGPFDENYWAWQAYVGLLHVKRRVTNPMMIGQIGLVERYVIAQLSGPEHQQLRHSVSRLLFTIAALIAYGYERSFLKAIGEVTGQDDALLARTVDLALESQEALQFKL